jgi:hypothetical protein
MYQKLAICLKLQTYQTKEIAMAFYYLTFSILQHPDTLKTYLKQNLYNYLYDIINEVQANSSTNQKFNSTELMRIINLLLNLGSQNEFFHFLEEKIMDKVKTPEELLKSLEQDEIKSVKFIVIN